MDLRQVRLRSNPRFRLVPYDRLSPAEQGAFRLLNHDREFYGILFPPPESGLPPKAVSRDAALLFLALRQPASLPNLLTDLLGLEAERRLRQLVADRVLEVESAGQFVSGPALIELPGGEQDGRVASRVARLSSEAIEYARALESLDLAATADCLYRFNAAPATPSLHGRFASVDRLHAFVQAPPDVQGRLQSDWRCESVADRWLVWSSRAAATPYKLYVSPLLEDLPKVFAVAVRAFAQVGCPTFKLGQGAFGLLRPDKLVAHFSSLDRLQRAAELIAQGAAEATAQGVPFSAPIDPAGLLSWGMDPPRFEQAPQAGSALSWRHWLCERIATYMVAARQSGGDVQAIVRQRVALDGVDPVDWTPDLAIWRAPLGTEPEVA